MLYLYYIYERIILLHKNLFIWLAVLSLMFNHSVAQDNLSSIIENQVYLFHAVFLIQAIPFSSNKHHFHHDLNQCTHRPMYAFSGYLL